MTIAEKTEHGLIDRQPVSQLLLDASNPRFGELDHDSEQNQIVDLIIKKFGIEDVISSLAINGYFDAEPLVCRRNADGTFTVAEGNRRLTACLVILADPRVETQSDC